MKPELFLPFFISIDASCKIKVPIILGLSNVLFVNVIVLESVAAIIGEPLILTCPLPFGIRSISISSSVTPIALILGDNPFVLFDIFKLLVDLMLFVSKVNSLFPFISAINPLLSNLGAIKVLFNILIFEFMVTISELFILTIPFPFPDKFKSTSLSIPFAFNDGDLFIDELLIDK